MFPNINAREDVQVFPVQCMHCTPSRSRPHDQVLSPMRFQGAASTTAINLRMQQSFQADEIPSHQRNYMCMDDKVVPRAALRVLRHANMLTC